MVCLPQTERETELDGPRTPPHCDRGNTGGGDPTATQSGLRLCRNLERVPDVTGHGPMTYTNEFQDSEMLVVHRIGCSEHRQGSPVVQGETGSS